MVTGGTYHLAFAEESAQPVYFNFDTDTQLLDTPLATASYV
jgi:hypothetical protein